MVEQIASQSTDVSAGVSPAVSEAAPSTYISKLFSPSLSPSTIVPSIFAGFITFISRAEELAHKNLSTLHITQDLKDKRSKEGMELAKKVEAKLISEPEANKQYLNLGRQFEIDKIGRFAKTGFGSFTNRLKVLRPHQWQEVIFEAGLTVVGSVIAIDALKEMMSSKKDREAIAAKNKDGTRDVSNGPGM